MDIPRAAVPGKLETAGRLYDPAVPVFAAAALLGHTSIIAFLLAQGANPNTGFPLQQGARNAHIGAARLLQAGWRGPVFV